MCVLLGCFEKKLRKKRNEQSYDKESLSFTILDKLLNHCQLGGKPNEQRQGDIVIIF
jgi:hypothetical protein